MRAVEEWMRKTGHDESKRMALKSEICKVVNTKDDAISRSDIAVESR
jgi:hypothetical protein